MLGFKSKDHLTSSDTATAIREYQSLYPTTSTTLLHESIEVIILLKLLTVIILMRSISC